ncbi:KAT8 regulatory NSL complex subunit 3-like [Anticarsia gemmatalis]|uniref:KAT8 regulatory NSL complex subunit 3-like n=1 Tax=Anticarsia gemmatalis TaxID=129554 RepID=UPI003F775C8F
MAAGSVCQQYNAGELSQEVSRGEEAAADAVALHERLVAYVHALAPPHEARSGVWVEHSYARARGAAHAPASHVRVLLAPRAASAAEPDDLVDVERLDPAPPEPPAPRRPARARSPGTDADDDGAEDDWEPRVSALAPGAAHARLADRALSALRRLRLARLAAGRAAAREHLRVAARRLRLALVAAAAAPGPQAQRPGPWLHATLLAYMPRAVRRMYDEVTSELRRAAPRLAERMMGGRAPPPRREPLAAVGPAVGAEGSPWLLWLGGGSERQDRRWRRRLSALLHTRLLAPPAPGAAPPDAWCGALAGATRAALAEALAEAGERPVILGGAGMGATLCLALAGAAGGVGAGRVCGLMLLAPPLLTAEGPRDSPDDPLAEIRLPMLVVAGTGAAQSWRGAVRSMCRRGGAGGEGRRAGSEARRVLEVRGADDLLRVPAAVRCRRPLPQHALDAAIAEECARWALDAAERGASGAEESPPPRPPRRRPAAGATDDEDYAHSPQASGRAERVAEAGEAGEGRMVSRGSGATPLALLPPRRAAPAPPAPPALAAADIMRLPIVFADDEGQYRSPEPEPAPDTPVTVTSGDSARRGAYSRVIVASRGGRAARGAREGPAGAGAGGGAGGARPLLLRRAVRLVPRAAPR